MSSLIRRHGEVAAALVIAAAATAGPAARAQSITRVNLGPSGAQSDYDAFDAALSADGRFVAFDSLADDLDSGDVNGSSDVFVHDRTTGAVELVSVATSGVQGDNLSVAPAISSDGRFVAFRSYAGNLVAGDTNGHLDVFVHDRASGTTERVSVDSNGAQADFDSFDPSISADGRFVTFASQATNLVASDTNGALDVFVRDRLNGTTTRASVRSNGNQANGGSSLSAISADGRFVAFASAATNLVANDTNHAIDVFVHELATGVTERVSVDSGGTQGDGDSGYTLGAALRVALSADGSLVAFGSDAKNLVPFDTNGTIDVFLHDRTTGATERVSLTEGGSEASGPSYDPSLSADGSVVTFISFADDLVMGDDNGACDVFVRDRAAATTEIMSRTCAGNLGDGASGSSGSPTSISGDGTLVAFDSVATNLVDDDTNHRNDAFVTDRTFQVDPASRKSYGAGLSGTLGVPDLAASADPAFGTSLTIDTSNSLGAWTVGFLVVGDQTAALHFRGGTLLVLPLVIVPEVIPPAGKSMHATIPRDESLCNVSIFLQAVEFDAGAVRGASMTAGLELHVGK